ncbi:MAG: hypothetical protein WBI04_03215, partial [Trichlorobacter sp.]
TRKKTNLMILLTPQVVKDARDMTAITDQQRDTFTEATKKTGKVDVQKAISDSTGEPAQKPQEPTSDGN